MKYLILLPLLTSCLFETTEAKFKRVATDICRCNKGLETAQLGHRSYLVTCRDGVQYSGDTKYEESPDLIGGTCEE